MCNGGGGGAMLSGHDLNSPSHKGEAYILSKQYACEKVQCSLLPIQAAAPDHLTLQGFLYSSTQKDGVYIYIACSPSCHRKPSTYRDFKFWLYVIHLTVIKLLFLKLYTSLSRVKW